MIEGYVGLPGSGKTYTLTERATRELRRGRAVFANYPIDGAEMFTPEDLLDLPPSVVILDEAHLWLSSRSFHKLPHSWLVQLSQTRKAGWSLLWSAQHPTRVDKALRDVTNVLRWCHCWPSSWDGSRRPYVFWDNVYEPRVAMEHDPKDHTIRLGTHRHWFKWKVARAYDTLGRIEAATHLDGDQYAELSKARKAS